MNPDCQLYVSSELDDPKWDEFVAITSGGHYSQTSLWAQVKATTGWQVARVIASDKENILGGAQLLIRSVRPFGAIGYLSKGPLWKSYDLQLLELIINKLHQISDIFHIQYLAIQPPSNDEILVQQLPALGFKQTQQENINDPGTILINLTQNSDDILARMKENTRKNIRRSRRKGVTTREGSEKDLDTFYKFLVGTGKRIDFVISDEAYYTKVWQIFAPHGYVKLFLAEYGNEPVSALLTMEFRDTVTTWRRGWSGRYGNLHPNEALYWEAIQWAKNHNYQYFDLGGIEIQAVKNILLGKPLPPEFQDTLTSFKLGFGGQVVLYPETYYMIYNPILRIGYDKIYPMIKRSHTVMDMIDLIRRR